MNKEDWIFMMMVYIISMIFSYIGNVSNQIIGVAWIGIGIGIFYQTYQIDKYYTIKRKEGF